MVRFYGAVLRSFGPIMTMEPAESNGWPAFLCYLNGELDGILTMHAENGLITDLYYVRNPEKLSRLTEETPLRTR